MNKKQWNIRRLLLALLAVGILFVFAARLMSIQIVQAAGILSSLEAVSVSRQTVKSTRGEIVDRNGYPLVSNSLGYDVIFDRAFLPRATQNDIIAELIRMFEKEGAGWNDALPVTYTQPFEFLPGYENEAERLRSYAGVQPYASADDVMFRLAERYKLSDYSDSELRRIVGVRYEMERRGFNNNVPYIFASNVDIGLVLQIKERGYLLGGVDINESAIRRYDQGDIAPHLIGFVGPIYAEDWNENKDEYKELGYSMDDVVGKSGAEAAFEQYLRGQNGERVIVLDSAGKVLEAQESTPPVPGKTISLTLDSHLQDVAQRALKAQIEYLQQNAKPGEGKEADAGAVAVIHPKTGQVLACATYPSYNLNTFLQDYSELAADELLPLFNRALQGTYAPGSTFKPVVGAAGLATGVINEHSTVNCGFIYTRFQDYQPRCLRADGLIGLNRAISLSCNIFFYDVGWNSGIDQIDKYARQFGLGEPTGIELYEEIGRRSNPEVAEARGVKWNNGDVLQSAIGQLYHGYTPLQLANYTATIANRGQRMKVTIVKEILDYSRQEVIQPFEPVVADTVDASREVFEAVIGGMVSASRTGTAAMHFGGYPFNVASKTGTPESDLYPNSTFICFGPAEDPEIAIAVVIQNGWHGYTGAPIAKAIMDEYFGISSANPLLSTE